MADDLYQAVLFTHIFGVFVFLLAHGVSVGVAFRLKVERNRDRVSALLDLSASSYKGLLVGFFLLLGSGIAMGALRGWWEAAWFWAAIVLLFVLSGIMTPMATMRYGKVRQGLGLKLPMGAKPKGKAPAEPMTDDEIARILSSVNPVLLTGVGVGGIAVLLWLMMFKPF